MNLLKGSAFLKIAALVAALLTYVYIQNEIRNTSRHNSYDASYKLLKLTAKTLPVEPRLGVAAAEGHWILEHEVSVSPALVTVIGPEVMLQDAESAQTSLLDVSEYTREVTKQVPLESVAGIHLTGEPYMISVTVPIEKILVPDEKPAEPSAATEAPAQADAPPAVTPAELAAA